MSERLARSLAEEKAHAMASRLGRRPAQHTEAAELPHTTQPDSGAPGEATADRHEEGAADGDGDGDGDGEVGLGEEPMHYPLATGLLEDEDEEGGRGGGGCAG